MENLINEIIAKEWPLFQSVNGGDHVSCQDDYKTFVIMRRAQYQAWSREALDKYAADLDASIAEGRNIVREKYIHMMRSTDPAGYQHFSPELPVTSEDKAILVSQIWTHLAAQTERMRSDYPFLAFGGRPLYARDECGWPSIETYQTSEMLTYSEATLCALLTHIENLEKKGKDFAFVVQENTIHGLGFPDMDTAEKVMAKQVIKEAGVQFGSNCCREEGCCGN